MSRHPSADNDLLAPTLAEDAFAPTSISSGRTMAPAISPRSTYRTGVSDISDVSDVSDGSGHASGPSGLSSPFTPATGAHLSTQLPPGTYVKHYELIRELGRGGMGSVYLARDTRLGRRVAIKFLQTNRPELNQRFLLEARATANCTHENIVVIHEVDQFEMVPYMVLEFLQGKPLSKLIRKGGKLPAQQAVEIMVPVVRALARAHAENIVHRDLKPDNIFITDSGTVKVLDFGIAKLVQQHEPQVAPPRGVSKEALAQAERAANSELTQRGALVGTLAYMSPEQWGIATVDHRADLWAVGILLYRMVAGRHPLAPLRGQQLVVTAMIDHTMPSAREIADIPAELATIIDRCLVKPKDQRISSAAELLQLLEPLLASRYRFRLSGDQSPYPGLNAFQESDANRFFGRSQEIAGFVTRLRDTPLMAVVGPSGVGKSSFIRAGVVPALKHSGESWETLVIRPGRHPLAALANVVAPMMSSSATSLAEDISEQQAVMNRLRQEPGFLGTVLRSRARRHNRRILLFIDQFEELYTLIPDLDERRAFTQCLAGVADDATAPLRVVVSVRSDFLDRVPEDQQFMNELTQGLFFLTAPNRGGLRDALVQPAEMAGYQFESGAMVEDMMVHLENTQGALPLLQFAAAKLWETRDTGRKLLTERSYQSIGGIAGALASHADSVLGELPSQSQALVKMLMLRLVTPERTRAIVSVSELAELSSSGDPQEIQRLIDHLVHARLLVVQTGDSGSGGGMVEIVHESLIHSWPLLRRWLDDNQDDVAFLDQLRIAAKQWQAKGYPSGLLWRGEAAEEAKRWHRRYRGELPGLQSQYLQAVFALAARGTRLRRAAIAVVIGFLSMALVLGAIALLRIRNEQMRAMENAEQARVAEQQAMKNAAQARTAEKTAVEAQQQAMEQLKLAQQKERERAEAAEAAEQANEQLKEALDRARRAMRRARRAQERAQANEELARRAESEARKAKEEVEKLLAAARERNKRLEEQLGGGSIITILK